MPTYKATLHAGTEMVEPDYFRRFAENFAFRRVSLSSTIAEAPATVVPEICTVTIELSTPVDATMVFQALQQAAREALLSVWPRGQGEVFLAHKYRD